MYTLSEDSMDEQNEIEELKKKYEQANNLSMEAMKQLERLQEEFGRSEEKVKNL